MIKNKNLKNIIINQMDNEEEFKESFDLFDKNEKGYVNKETARNLFNSFGVVITDDELDNLGDKITYDIFLTSIKNKLKNSKDDNLEKYFEGLLSKKTGKLSAKLFRKELMNFGIRFSRAETDELLKEFKVDEEGNINWKDFCRAMK